MSSLTQKESIYRRFFILEGEGGLGRNPRDVEFPAVEYLGLTVVHCFFSLALLIYPYSFPLKISFFSLLIFPVLVWSSFLCVRYGLDQTQGLCWEISCILIGTAFSRSMHRNLRSLYHGSYLPALLACLSVEYLFVCVFSTHLLSLSSGFLFFFFFSIFFAYSHFVTLLAKLVRPALIAKKLKKRHILK